jgi:hypothetical protein
VISQPGSRAGPAINLHVGTDPATDHGTSCLDVGHASTVAQKNTVANVGVAPLPDIYFSMNAGATAELPGYGGTAHSTVSVNSYLQGRNDVGAMPTVISEQASSSSNYVTATSCTTP